VSEPDEGGTAEQPVATPTVSTAPPPSRARRMWSAIPSHVGPARTSTVVLAVLFLAIGALYLNVRPAPVAAVPSGGGGTVQTATVVPTRKPSTTAAPTTAPESTTGSVPTTTEATTSGPTDTATETPTSEPSTDSGPPTSLETTPPPTSPDSAPPASSPPG